MLIVVRDVPRAWVARIQRPRRSVERRGRSVERRRRSVERPRRSVERRGRSVERRRRSVERPRRSVEHRRRSVERRGRSVERCRGRSVERSGDGWNTGDDRLNTGDDRLNAGGDRLNAGDDRLNARDDRLNARDDRFDACRDRLSPHDDRLNAPRDRLNRMGVRGGRGALFLRPRPRHSARAGCAREAFCVWLFVCVAIAFWAIAHPAMARIRSAENIATTGARARTLRRRRFQPTDEAIRAILAVRPVAFDDGALLSAAVQRGRPLAIALGDPWGACNSAGCPRSPLRRRGALISRLHREPGGPASSRCSLSRRTAPAQLKRANLPTPP